MSKILLIGILCTSLSACQLIQPNELEYNGVRSDIAQWINSQSSLSMQQKRSLAQLSRAQQKLLNIDKITTDQKLNISKENTIAMHCAYTNLSHAEIEQLQDKIFKPMEKIRILEIFEREFPQIKLDPASIQCD